jgi:hypothetical protein
MTLEIDIEGRTYRAVPESWVEAGEHHDPDSGAARRFCTLAATAGDEIRVRYVHPVNSGVIKVIFDAVDIDTGLIPKQLTEEHVDWPISITRDPWADLNRPGAVRHGERDVLWELHGKWLQKNTRYRQDDNQHLVADGGWNIEQTATVWCRECDGEREVRLVAWNPIGRPIWHCDECEERQVGPDRGRGRSGSGGAPFAADGGDQHVQR